MSLNDYFDRIFVINLKRSADRLRQCCVESDRHGFDCYQFPAFDWHDYKNLPELQRTAMNSGMCGCSHSHSSLMHVIAFNKWDKVLVLEDDFEILNEDFNERFAEAWAEVPADWDLVYLGAHYGEVPTIRLSKHLVRAGYIKTTSSYAIRGRHARFMAPLMASCAGPDDNLSGMNSRCNAYVLHPRLMGQRKCMSDIWGYESHNTQCMTDPHHDAAVEALPYEH